MIKLFLATVASALLLISHAEGAKMHFTFEGAGQMERNIPNKGQETFQTFPIGLQPQKTSTSFNNSASKIIGAYTNLFVEEAVGATGKNFFVLVVKTSTF